MKKLSLLLWVTQFGFSVLSPLCIFLVLGSWLQTRFCLGLWVIVVCGILGILTTVSTARACIRGLRAEAERNGSGEKPPVGFNDHE